MWAHAAAPCHLDNEMKSLLFLLPFNWCAAALADGIAHECEGEKNWTMSNEGVVVMIP